MFFSSKSSFLFLVSVLLLSVSAFATAPKQVCEVYKELRLVSVGRSARNTSYEVKIEFLQMFLMGNASKIEPEVLTLEKVMTDSKTFVANQKFEKTVASVQYERTVLGVKTTFFEVRGDKRRVLSEEIDYAKNYQYGEARPLGPVVCFNYAQ